MSDFLDDILADLGAASGGVVHIQVQHAYWCPLLACMGDCACNPVVRIVDEATGVAGILAQNRRERRAAAKKGRK